jgi:tRNA uridine 5-carbamoylmethylation protein Kti12
LIPPCKFIKNTTLFPFFFLLLYFVRSLAEIAARFEVPIEKNRWDSPLFRLTPESITKEGLPLEAISNALQFGKAVKAGLATQAVSGKQNLSLFYKNVSIYFIIYIGSSSRNEFFTGIRSSNKCNCGCRHCI